jgi:hypothetical protein
MPQVIFSKPKAAGMTDARLKGKLQEIRDRFKFAPDGVLTASQVLDLGWRKSQASPEYHDVITELIRGREIELVGRNPTRYRWMGYGEG